MELHLPGGSEGLYLFSYRGQEVALFPGWGRRNTKDPRLFPIEDFVRRLINGAKSRFRHNTVKGTIVEGQKRQERHGVVGKWQRGGGHDKCGPCSGGVSVDLEKSKPDNCSRQRGLYPGTPCRSLNSIKTHWRRG